MNDVSQALLVCVPIWAALTLLAVVIGWVVYD